MPARELKLALLSLAGAVALAAAPAGAQADTVASSNWSGFAAHRPGLRFSRVSAAWTQPRATCSSGQDTYSSFWVGLGGYSARATGLEQIGTELDCNAAGQQRSTVWYELVPAPAHPIAMTARPGDRMSASVIVSGHRATLELVDITRGRSFSKQLTTRNIDVSSAEWIAEAPSACDPTGSCQTLPLADFGTAHFTSATAQTLSGHQGTIADPSWRHTRLVLSESASPFSGSYMRRSATPTGLQSQGSAFLVQYRQSSGAAPRRLAASSARSVPVVQPGGSRR